MRTHDEIEQARETRIERTGYTPDLVERQEGEPTGDGLHGRYCVVAVYPSGTRKVLSRWATSTMANRIAAKVAAIGGAFSIIGVMDESDPERGWLTESWKGDT